MKDATSMFTHHDASGDGHDAATVRVGHNVAVTDGQERDGDHPHRVEDVRVLVRLQVAKSSRTTPGQISVWVFYKLQCQNFSMCLYEEHTECSVFILYEYLQRPRLMLYVYKKVVGKCMLINLTYILVITLNSIIEILQMANARLSYFILNSL